MKEGGVGRAGGGRGVRQRRRRGRGQVCMLAITLFKQMAPASAQQKLQLSHQRKSVYVFISFFSLIYTYRFVNSVVTVIPLIPYYYQLYKISNKKQTDFQNLSHQKFTLYIYEKVFTCKNFICRKNQSLLQRRIQGGCDFSIKHNKFNDETQFTSIYCSAKI